MPQRAGAEKERDYIKLLSEMNADGIVITANNDGLEEEIRRCRLPVVVVDRRLGGSMRPLFSRTII